ncbi:MAG: pilin [Patescibacteria group bacterium]
MFGKKTKIFISIAVVFLVGVFFTFYSVPVAQAANGCFCSSNLEQATAENLTGHRFDATCTTNNSQETCNGQSEAICARLGFDFCSCLLKNTDESCANNVSAWRARYETIQRQSAADESEASSGGIVGAFMPRCATEDNLSGECRSVDVFIILAINIGRWLFSIIGALALGAFVFGGFTLVMSSGNPEEVKKGKNIMIAAVTGLLVAFGAYLLINFLGDAVGIKGEFKL